MPTKVLIVDNEDSTILNIFNNELDNHNYSVISNPKGKCAFKQIEQEKPDIVLLNIHFPETTDTYIAEYLSEQEIPFIYMSSAQEQSILKQCHSTNALGLLLKPVNINQLVIEIETALHLHNERIELDRRKENINTTIDNNRKISVAIGIIMERYNSIGTEAFEAIRRAARTKQCRILDISNTLIEDHEKILKSLSKKSRRPNATNSDDKKSFTIDEMLNKIIESTTNA